MVSFVRTTWVRRALAIAAYSPNPRIRKQCPRVRKLASWALSPGLSGVCRRSRLSESSSDCMASFFFSPLSDRSVNPPDNVFDADGQPSLLVYSALGMPPFRSIKLRKRRITCPACGIEGQKVGKIEDVDYVEFCGGARPDWVTLGLKPGDTEWRITANVGLLCGQTLFQK
jgi:hypothetical protein